MKTERLLAGTFALLLVGAFSIQLVAKERAEPTSGAAGVPASPSALALRDTTKTISVSGVVVAADGRAESGVSVRALTHDEHEPVAESDPQGRFQLRVDRARVRGLVILGHTVDKARQGFFELDWNPEPAKALPPVRLTMGPARSINVQVVDRTGKPVPGAVVGVVGAYVGLDTGHSDQQGQFTLRIPAQAPLQNIYALKAGLGLDYLSLPKAERATTGDQPQPPDLSRPVNLRLTAARTVRIKLIDPEGRPIEGIRVSPWYFQKPQWGHLDGLNISGVGDFQKKTDAAGIAIFDWIPSWNKQSVTFWSHDRELWTRPRITWNPEKDPPEKTAQLQRTVPIRGRVRHADGAPAAGILIQAAGAERSGDPFRGETWTDAKGRFELRVYPGLRYMFAVTDSRWAAAARTEIAVNPDAPADGIDFQLSPAKRIHGHVTIGPDRKPRVGQTMSLAQSSIMRSTATDAQGHYEFHVGPGDYSLWGPENVEEQRFSIGTEESVTLDFHMPRAARGIIGVQVVLQGKDPQPVAGAQVLGMSRSSMIHELSATTDHRGRFRIERWLDEMWIHARSKDGKLTGAIEITEDQTEVTIPVKPSASLRGRLVDAATGQPVPGCNIVAIVVIHTPRGGNSMSLASTKTDAGGRFVLAGLAVGVDYRLEARLQAGGGPSKPSDHRSLGDITPRGPDVQLGDVDLKPR